MHALLLVSAAVSVFALVMGGLVNWVASDLERGLADLKIQLPEQL